MKRGRKREVVWCGVGVVDDNNDDEESRRIVVALLAHGPKKNCTPAFFRVPPTTTRACQFHLPEEGLGDGEPHGAGAQDQGPGHAPAHPLGRQRQEGFVHLWGGWVFEMRKGDVYT